MSGGGGVSAANSAPPGAGTGPPVYSMYSSGTPPQAYNYNRYIPYNPALQNPVMSQYNGPTPSGQTAIPTVYAPLPQTPTGGGGAYPQFGIPTLTQTPPSVTQFSAHPVHTAAAANTSSIQHQSGGIQHQIPPTKTSSTTQHAVLSSASGPPVSVVHKIGAANIHVNVVPVPIVDTPGVVHTPTTNSIANNIGVFDPATDSTLVLDANSSSVL